MNENAALAFAGPSAPPGGASYARPLDSERGLRFVHTPGILGGQPAAENLIPIARPSLPELAQILPELETMFETGALTKGPHLQELEERAAARAGTAHALGVSSCTLGLMLTYRGLGLTGEVIVPSFTFMATVHPLVWVGATPVFVDVDRATWSLDPGAVEAAITPRTTGIVGVHTFGAPAAIEELQKLGERYGLKVVFDSAHAFGSSYEGANIGSFGDAEVFSMTPTKLLVAGEGGIVTTDDDDLARFVRIGREYGNPGDYGSDFAGLNARLPEFSALLGLRSLDLLDSVVEERNGLVDHYRQGLADVKGLTFQVVRDDDRSTYKDLSMLVEDEFGVSRDDLATALRADNVDTRKYFDPPVHRHKAYGGLTKEPLPVTEDLAMRSLSLPLWVGMGDESVELVCDAIKGIQAAGPAIKEAVSS